MNLNKKISEYFLTDCREYLIRYEILRNNSTYLGNRSKLLVDLLFALECLLKSIIFIESVDLEKDTYSKIITHDLKDLYNKLTSESRKKYQECIKYDLSEYQISIRYQVESEIDFRNDQGVLDSRYYNTIADPDWLEDVYKQIKDLLLYADKINPIVLSLKSINDININEELQNVKTLRNIREKK